MEKVMTAQELISRTCSMQAYSMVIMRMQCRIIAEMQGVSFDVVLAEAIEEASGITKVLYESLPTNK